MILKIKLKRKLKVIKNILNSQKLINKVKTK